MSGRKIVALNKRARFDYLIETTVEAGLVLQGSEVKSLRRGQGSITEAYASQERSDELFLINAFIPEYTEAGRFNHDPRRHRKLLLRRREINRLGGLIQKKGKTLLPLSIYFNERGKAKVELGVGVGKKKHDKRETEKQRDWQREKGRVLKGEG